mmetsp:Transcript_7121/g.27287  ORF Transcript_7121/g.27287 Transcript_7121/m.27287 type:complete len:347 (-) Transcript_7121:112-1152(-)
MLRRKARQRLGRENRLRLVLVIHGALQNAAVGVLENRRAVEGRIDRAHGDPARLQFNVHRLRQSLRCPFRSLVTRRTRRGRRKARLGRNRDDPGRHFGVPGYRLPEQGHKERADLRHAHDVDSENLVPRLLGRRLDVSNDANPGVVYHRVKQRAVAALEELLRGLEQSAPLPIFRHVALDCREPACMSFPRPGLPGLRQLGHALRAQASGHHEKSLLSQMQRRRKAEARIAAGDHDNSPAGINVPPVSIRLVRRGDQTCQQLQGCHDRHQGHRDEEEPKRPQDAAQDRRVHPSVQLLLYPGDAALSSRFDEGNPLPILHASVASRSILPHPEHEISSKLRWSPPRK